MDKMVVDDDDVEGVDNENDSDDSNSAISTDEFDHEPPDGDVFDVKQILAEKVIGGQQMFLIEWVGWDLLDATWEPYQHLHDESVLEGWERIKTDKAEASKAKSRFRQWLSEKTAQVQERRARHEEENKERARKGRSPIPLDDFTRKAIFELQHFSMEVERSGAGGGAVSQPSRDTSTAASAISRARNTADPGSEERLLGRRRLSLGSNLSSCASSASVKQSVLRRLSSDAIPTETLKPKETRWQGTARPGQSSQGKPATTRSVAFRPGPPLFRGSAGVPKKIPKAQTQPAGTTSNVFAGGKEPRSRGTLREAASDPSKGQRMLGRRFTREIEKQSRDHEGETAPAQQPRHLISLDRHNPHGIVREDPGPSAPATSFQPSVDLMDLDGGEVIESSGPEPRLGEGTTASSERPAAAPKALMTAASGRSLRKKKSVTWSSQVGGSGGSGGESSLCVRGESSLSLDGMGTDHRGDSSKREPTPMEGVSAPVAPMSHSGGDRVPSACKTIQKLSQLGTSSLQFINLSFHGVPATNDPAWVAGFQNEDQMIFTHICSAKDFQSQRLPAVSHLLAGGTVSSFANSASLAVLADRLRLGPRGLLCRIGGFFMLLFPPGCDDWNFLFELSASVSGATCVDHPLRYIIFEPQSSFEDHLAPVSFNDLLDEPDASSTLYTRKFERIFGLEYEDLLPQSVRTNPNARHSFFLLFPHRAEKEAITVSRWLKAVHPDCEVLSSLSPGQWTGFLSLEHGSVIFHEDCLPLIRKIPNLGGLLHKRREDFGFLAFERSIPPTSILESGEVVEHRLGNIHLREILKDGIAVLLTPSFILAHPKRTYTILKWFHEIAPNDGAGIPHARVAVWHGMSDWLRDLALEKTEKQRHLAKSVSDDELRSMGLDDDSLLVRWQTFDLVNHITIGSASETSDLLAFAPRSIDGNDEQSLVNWFGWWSVMNVEPVRRFAVLGSNPTSRERLARCISFPSYAPGTQSDPDAFGVAEGPPPGTPTAPRAPANEAPALTRDLLWVVDIIKGSAWCPVVLYHFPIAHWHVDMPWQHGDIRSDFRSYKEWIRFYKENMPIGRSGMAKNPHNTYAGFFHTAEEDSETSSSHKPPHRHPWIAILRPEEVHKKPWCYHELLIWDMAFEKKQAELKDSTSHDLQDAHRELVYQVRDALAHDMPLRSVWVGGFPVVMQNPGDNPVSVTLDSLKGIVEDVRKWLPPKYSNLVNKGWSPVRVDLADAGRSGNPSPTSASGVSGRNGPVSDKKQTTLAQIFHPPRGDREREPSNCRNHLFDAAVSAQGAAAGTTFDYLFQTTAEWYRAQCQEGRGYEHVWVTTWEEFYKAHNIPWSQEI